MKVTCGHCGATDDVEPPAWLLSTGRAFHMPCPACGKDIEVRPIGLAMMPGAPAPMGMDEDSTEEIDPPLKPAAAPSHPEPKVVIAPPAPPPFKMPYAAASTEQDQANRATTAPRRVPTPDEPPPRPPKPAPSSGLSSTPPSLAHVLDEGIDPALPVGGPREAVRASSEPKIVLRQDGERYLVKDVATLQRWIMEQRVDPEDEVQIDDGPFMAMRDKPEYQVFFDAVMRLERRGEMPDGPTTGVGDHTNPDAAQIKPPPPRRVQSDEVPIPAPLSDEWTDEAPPIPTEERPGFDDEDDGFIGFEPPSISAAVPASGTPIDDSFDDFGAGVSGWDPDDDLDTAAFHSDRKMMYGLLAVSVLVIALGSYLAFPTGTAAPDVAATAAATEPMAAEPEPVSAAGSEAPAPEPETPAEPQPEPEPEPEPETEPARPATPPPSPAPTRAPARTRAASPAPRPEPSPDPAPRTTAPARSTASTAPAPRPRPAASSSEPPMPQLASKAPQDASYEALIDGGWSAVDRGDATTAMAMFQRALELKASGVEAAYGLGYALLASGRPTASARYLCRALVRGDASMVAEIKGLMSRRNLACP